MSKFNFIKTDIPDVQIIEPTVFGDDRGYFMETYQKDQFCCCRHRQGVRAGQPEPLQPAACCAACISRRITPRASWCV